LRSMPRIGAPAPGGACAGEEEEREDNPARSPAPRRRSARIFEGRRGIGVHRFASA
jgi:hypothetical protein